MWAGRKACATKVAPGSPEGRISVSARTLPTGAARAFRANPAHNGVIRSPLNFLMRPKKRAGLQQVFW
jgi:hypothetical protein